MYYILYEAPNVSIPLSVVEDPQTSGSLVVMGMAFELMGISFWNHWETGSALRTYDSMRSPLSTNYSTHTR